jgi:hypothetical protein
MKLSESQLKLIREVRHMMKSPYPMVGAQAYICWNLLIAATASYACLYERTELGEQIRKVGGDAYELWTAIDKALERDGTMENYVARVIQESSPRGYYNPDLRRTVAVEYAAQARLAWLDRMIETGELA